MRPERAIGPTGEDAIRIRFSADALSVRHTLQTMRRVLERRHAGQDFSMFELVLAEVLNNVVEHAYAGCPEGIVRLFARSGGDEIEVTVTDSGKSFPAGVPPLRDFPVVDADDPPEGGFGWPLIRALCTALRYRREGERNILDFTMRLEQVTAGSA